MKIIAALLVYAALGIIGYGLYLLHPALGWIAGGIAVLTVAGLLLSAANKREKDREHGRPVPMRPAGGYGVTVESNRFGRAP